MATCQICKYAGTPSYKSPCSECKGFSQYEYKKPMNNADRIRAMSNHELARFLLMEVVNEKCYGICHGSCTGNDCISGIVEWLNSPAQED